MIYFHFKLIEMYLQHVLSTFLKRKGSNIFKNVWAGEFRLPLQLPEMF